MKKRLHPIWLIASFLFLTGYVYLAHELLKDYPKDDDAQELWIYSIMLIALFLVLFFFRRIGAFKLAFIVMLIETTWAVLSPYSFFELNFLAPLMTLWLPSCIVAMVLQKRGDFEKGRYVPRIALLFTYLFFPVTASLGMVLHHYYKYIIPLNF